MKHLFKDMLYVIFFCSTLFISSCSKDDSNPAGPAVVVNIKGSLVSYDPGAGGFKQTILKADLLFDGNVIASANFQTPDDTALLDGTVNSAKGTHTIAFRITNQSSSPSYYGTYDVKMTVGNSVSELEHKFNEAMATGQSITYSVTIE